MSDLSTSSDSARVEDAEFIRLDVPASTEHLRLVRLLVSSVATSHGADLNDLEDLRLAAGEVCAHAISVSTALDRLSISATVETGAGAAPVLVLRASVTEDRDPGPLDDLSSMVLDAATDDHGVGVDQGEVTVWFRRTVSPAAPADQPVD